MGRQLRFDPPGGLHHVMHRGSRRQLIFENGVDRREFLERLADVPRRSDVRIHAFALMPNHYHLLVECPTGGLSAAMKQLNAGYAQWFNWKHSYDGHLFRGRFRSILIGGDSYFVEVARYIHRNSLAAGLVAQAALDPWSSHRLYLASTSPSWFTTDRVLGYFGQDPDRFAAFVDAPDSIAARSVIEAVEARRPAVGSRDYLVALTGDVSPVAATASSARRLVPVHMDSFARAQQCQPGIGDHVTMAAARRLGIAFGAIAAHFGIERESTVRSRVHRIERRAKSDPTLEDLIVDAIDASHRST